MQLTARITLLKQLSTKNMGKSAAEHGTLFVHLFFLKPKEINQGPKPS